MKKNEKMSDELKLKISKANKGQKNFVNKTSFKKGGIPWNKGKKLTLTEETKNKIKLARAGKKTKPCSEERKQKISLALKGKALSEETKKKIGIANTKLTNEERITNRKNAKKANKLNRKKAGNLCLKTIQQVYEDNIKKYGTLTCYLCLKKINLNEEHIEHKTPLSRGGSNDYENIAIACSKCNLKKGNKTVEEYKIKITRIA